MANIKPICYSVTPSLAVGTSLYPTRWVLYIKEHEERKYSISHGPDVLRTDGIWVSASDSLAPNCLYTFQDAVILATRTSDILLVGGLTFQQYYLNETKENL